MANFNTSYQLTNKHEGFYVNDPRDAGAETYMGISRRFHSRWSGWAMIDRYKSVFGQPAWNTNLDSITGLHAAHAAYAKKYFWDPIQGDGIASQPMADLLYDTYWGKPGVTVRALQRILGVVADGRFGPITLSALNTHPNLNQVYNALYDWRIAEYQKSKDWNVWKNGWMARFNSFPRNISSPAGDPVQYASVVQTSKNNSMTKNVALVAAAGLFIFTIKK